MSREFGAADHAAASEAWEQAGIDGDDAQTEVYYWGFKAGCLHARSKPGPATAAMVGAIDRMTSMDRLELADMLMVDPNIIQAFLAEHGAAKAEGGGG